jgi:hypothetical protein
MCSVTSVLAIRDRCCTVEKKPPKFNNPGGDSLAQWPGLLIWLALKLGAFRPLRQYVAEARMAMLHMRCNKTAFFSGDFFAGVFIDDNKLNVGFAGFESGGGRINFNVE